MLQKIMFIIFLIQTICEEYNFWNMHLRIIKITVKKMIISLECFACFRWDLQIWKEQSFYLTIDTEGITQLLQSNFKASKRKWRHRCKTFTKKETFIWTCHYVTEWRIKCVNKNNFWTTWVWLKKLLEEIALGHLLLIEDFPN